MLHLLGGPLGDGKVRVTSAAWLDAKVLLEGEVFEVRLSARP
jgi:hypothetical protein